MFVYLNYFKNLNYHKYTHLLQIYVDFPCTDLSHGFHHVNVRHDLFRYFASTLASISWLWRFTASKTVWKDIFFSCFLFFLFLSWVVYRYPLCILQRRSNELEFGEQTLRVDMQMWMEALEVNRKVWEKASGDDLIEWRHSGEPRVCVTRDSPWIGFWHHTYSQEYNILHSDSLLHILTSLYAIIILLSHTQILYFLNAHQTYWNVNRNI